MSHPRGSVHPRFGRPPHIDGAQSIEADDSAVRTALWAGQTDLAAIARTSRISLARVFAARDRIAAQAAAARGQQA